MNDWNSEENQFENGVKLDGNNSFAALQEACKDLVIEARKKLPEKSSEEDGDQQK